MVRPSAPPLPLIAIALCFGLVAAPVSAFEWTGKRVEVAKGLDSPAPRDRIAALRALALFPASPEVLDLVRGALGDSSVQVRLCAIEVLAELGAQSEEAAIFPFLTDADADVRGAAVRALGRIGSADSVDPLIRTLGDPDANVRRGAIEALCAVDPERARVPIARLLDDTEEEVVLAAVDALARSGGPTAVFPLLEKVKAPSIKTQVAAVTGLGKLGDSRAALPLAALLDDGHPEVRAAAIVALGELRDPAATPHLVGALWRNQHETLASPILRSLGQIGDPKAIPALLQMLRFSEHRRLAARALEDTGAPAVEPILSAMQRDTDGAFVQSCLEVLTVILEEGAPATQRDAANRVFLEMWTRGNVSQEVLVGALVAGRDPTSAMVLATHLRSLAGTDSADASRLRRRILSGLADWGDDVPVNPLLTAWPDLPASERTLALRTLGATRSPKAVRLLAHELTRDDEAIQVEAARALSQIDDPRAAKALLERLDNAPEALLHEIGIGLGRNRSPGVSGELIRRLPSSRGPARQTILMALADHYRRGGETSVADALWAVAKSDPVARERALDVLGTRPDKALAERAAALYPNATAPLKRKIVQLLGDAGAGRDVIMEALGSPQPALRAEAAWALRSFEGAPMAGLLDDPAPAVRINASAALAARPVDTIDLAVAAAAASGPTRANLLVAIERTGGSGPERGALLAMVRRDADPLVAEAAVSLLVARGEPADRVAALGLHKRARDGGNRAAMGRRLGLLPPAAPGEGWVRFLFTDGPERLPGQRVLVILPDGIVIAQQSDDAGEIRLEALPPGVCRLRFLDDNFSGP